MVMSDLEYKKIKKNFLDMLRDRNIHVREDIVKEKKKKSKEIIEEEIEEKIIPMKKIFKHEKPLDKLKEVHNEI